MKDVIIWAGLILFGLWAWSQKEASAGVGQMASLSILDVHTGQPLVGKSPISVMEGESYVARLTITNQSTQAGQPTAADLLFNVVGQTSKGSLFSGATRKDSFLPGETKSFDFPFSIPAGVRGINTTLQAMVTSPAGQTIGSASAELAIQSAPIVYLAQLVFGGAFTQQAVQVQAEPTPIWMMPD